MLSRCLILFACAPLLAQSPFRFREPDGSSLELLENGAPVFVYNNGMILRRGASENMRRCCYLHPVYAPGGTVITDDFNPDHAHHRGISWMWPVVRYGGRTYDMWTLAGDLRDRFVRWTAREALPDAAVLGVENGWFLGDRRLVKENVEIRVSPAASGRRTLDFIVRLEPETDPVEIVGTPEDNKGFGGFSFRFAPRDGGPPKTTIRTERGVEEKDGVLAQRRWAGIEGIFAGRRAGARVYDDPANPGFPNGWLMRHGFGFLNVSFPGLNAVRLEPGRPLVLKYRVVLFSDRPPPE